ncbi:MAG: hypothetical protein OEW60_06280 [Thiovulaceae bacterium]|nr:hypothetical protein [Sulfurimonadaceae bacterium]
MDRCEGCKNFLECQEISVPMPIIAFVIDEIEAQHVDEVVNARLIEKFGVDLESYGTNIKMFRKYILEFEDSCKEHRDSKE